MPATTLSEVASKRLVADHGVPVPDERVITAPADAAAAAVVVGFPVVLKLCGDTIVHKTERGLVRLGVSSPYAAVAITTELLATATADDGDVSVIVAPTVRGARELIAGLSRDPAFGMTVRLGLGGILAEALGDIVFRLVPIDRRDAGGMIDDLATQKVLGPFWGEPAVDRERLVDVLVGLSALAEARPDVVAVDLDPLIVRDGVPVAVDALVEFER